MIGNPELPLLPVRRPGAFFFVLFCSVFFLQKQLVKVVNQTATHIFLDRGGKALSITVNEVSVLFFHRRFIIANV